MKHLPFPATTLLATLLGLSFAQPLSAQTLADAIDQPTLSITHSGNLPWTAQTTTTHDGVDAAKSGPITHNQTSEISTTVTGPGTLSFWWKVSSESSYDYLRFYIDGVEQSGGISGTVDWAQKSYGLAVGSHTLKWAYSKDSSDSSGSDCGWVDQVAFVPVTPLPEIAVEQPAGTNLVDGSASVAFGSVDLGMTVVKTFTIRNLGNIDLSGLAVSKDGAATNECTLSSFEAVSLAPGASTTFTVTFAPVVAGSKTAAIHIASNDADENPFDINLSGTATLPFTYTTSGGQITITGYNGSGGAVVLPGLIDGLPVIHIGSAAFRYKSSITSVTLPNSVTSIGYEAFCGCGGLTSVTFPSNLTSIATGAFTDCSALTSVTIPNNVTSIGDQAFYYCSKLTSVTIPNSVTSMGSSAFSQCAKLTLISVDSLNPNYSSLDGVLFNKSQNLLIQCPAGKTGIYAIPNSVTTIGYYAFSSCYGLTSVTIPNSVTSIGDSAFSSCYGLTSVTIPNNVTSIGDSAFYGCSGLTSVTVPNSVTSIGVGPFSRCSKLNLISVDSLNQNYSSLDGVLFSKDQSLLIQCPATKAGVYVIPSSVTNIGDDAFSSCSGLTSVMIPNGVTSIGADAFYYCSGLTSMTIPISVTSIGNDAFSYCRGLTSMTIPISVTSIGNQAFYACSGLNSATFLGNAPTTGSQPFSNAASNFKIYYYNEKSGFTSPTWMGYATEVIPSPPAPEIAVEQPAGTYLADGSASVAFGNTNLGTNVVKTFTIKNFGTADSLTGLSISKDGPNASDYTLSSLGTTTLAAGASATFTVTFAPASQGSKSAAIHITSNDADENPFDINLIGSSVPFSYTSNAGKVTITGYTGSGGAVAIPAIIDGSPVVSIGDSAFSYNSSITSVTIPDSVTDIGYFAFSGCTSLISVTIPNSVISIGDLAFNYCPRLRNVTIGNGVTGIGHSAFKTCLSLTSVTIPASVTSIGDSAFGSCSGLTSVTIPASVASIGSGAFSYCTNLIAITVDAGNAIYSSLDGILFNKGVTTLIQYPNGKNGPYSIPASVTSIGISAFDSCRDLTSVTIPASVTSIPHRAFFDCRGLTSVTIPNRVTSIGDSAFGSCSGLTSVTIPTSVTSIGEFAFGSCSGLTSVTIPTSVASIGSGAFSSCTNLMAITVDAGNASYSSLDGVLFNKGETTLIQYPNGRDGPYSIPKSVTSIGNSAFRSCSGLSSVSIPDSVASIGPFPFYDCTQLTSIAVGAGNANLSSLDGVLFDKTKTVLIRYPCNKTGAYTIPSSVTSISDSAFWPCNGLTSVTIPTSVTGIGNQAFAYCRLLKRATFLGNAPSMQPYVFYSAASGFTVYYDPAKTGFTTPTWQGYTTRPLSATKEIAVASQSEVNMTDGGVAIDLGDVYLGAVSQHVFTIRNLGATDLTGLAITKDGANAAEFTIGSMAATTLTPGDETSFTVTFAPTASGVRNAAIHISSNDADENPFDISLTGDGLDRVAPFENSRRIASTMDEDFEPAVGMALDAQGNRLMTGWFDGTNDFGGASLTALAGGGQEIFVGKYNSAGSLVWARRAGGATVARDAGRGIGVDSAGNVYVTGGFSGTADFGSFSLTASQSQDFFLAKYNSAGTVQWVRQNTAGAAADSAYGTGLAVDGAGNSYAVGHYDGNNLRFGSTTLPSPADYQCFLVKHDAAGAVQWAKALAASGQAYATKLALDTLGNVCVGGGFSGNMNLDGTVLTSVGSRDLFVAKFSASGILQWARRAGGTGKDEGDGGVAIDSENNVIFGGAFESASIDIGGIVLSNSGGMDGFIAKYSPSGTVLWARKNGTSGLDFVASVAVDRNGSSYAAGTLGSSGGTAGVAKYDRNGTLQWEYAARGAPADPVASIAGHCAVDAAGNCHLVGWYLGQATFGSQTLQPQGLLNYFLTTVPADPFVGVYPGQLSEGHPNIIYLEQDGLERTTDFNLTILRNDATRYTAEVREGPDGGVVPNLIRTGNRLQLAASPLDMGTSNLLDFIVLSDGTNRVSAGIGQEKDDATDIGISMESWSSFTGPITVDDFVGTWTFEFYEARPSAPTARFQHEEGTEQFEARKTGANSLELVTPWGYSLPLRVEENQAYLEASTLVPGHSHYFAFRMCTDGQKLSFHVLGKDIEDNEIFAVMGLGVKQATTKPVVATLAASSVSSGSSTLNGTVNPNGFASTAQFEYGLTTSYGSTSSVSLSPNNGSTTQNVSVMVNGLEPGRTYHYRFTANNSGGAGNGADMTFTTPAVDTPFSTWLLTKGLPANTNLFSDHNGDGVSLLMAYAFNLNPAHNLSGSMPRPVVTADRMDLTFYAGNADVTYLVETSTDLSVWSTAGVTLTAADANGLRTATFLKAGPTRFMRLRPVIRDSVYGPWREAAFSLADLANAAVSGDLADPDRDGIPNLLEYAMGGQPKAPDTNFQPGAGRSGGYLTLTYRQSKSATDIAFMPQATGNPSSGIWSSAGLAETGRTDHGTYWLVTVRDAVPIATAPARFMRLTVER